MVVNEFRTVELKTSPCRDASLKQLSLQIKTEQSMAQETKTKTSASRWFIGANDRPSLKVLAIFQESPSLSIVTDFLEK